MAPARNLAPHRPRKIPVHPYIAASKSGMYEDPDTGLKFPTDISEYLGHDRKVTGRHTLGTRCRMGYQDSWKGMVRRIL